MNDGASGGNFVTGTFDYDEGRQVTVYVPSNPPEAIIFSGDGQQIAANALDAAGAEVVLKEREGPHGGEFWQTEFPLMVAWALSASGTNSKPEL